MDKFLVKYDFETLIQEVNLDEITSSTDRIVNDSIDEAVSEAAGYIRNRYDEDSTFKVVQAYSLTAVYNANDRVFWSPTAYDSTKTYVANDQVSFDIGTDPEIDEKIYIANQSVAIGETPSTTPTKWDLKADNNTFYTCIATTLAGELPTLTTKFTAGDNREPKLKTVVVDIALYNIHSRITPRDIPEIRQIRYDGAGNHAIGWLEKVQKGTITPNLTVRTNTDGETEQNTERISYGASPTNSYKY
jgi:hypothetical protein